MNAGFSVSLYRADSFVLIPNIFRVFFFLRRHVPVRFYKGRNPVPGGTQSRRGAALVLEGQSCARRFFLKISVAPYYRCTRYGDVPRRQNRVGRVNLLHGTLSAERYSRHRGHSHSRRRRPRDTDLYATSARAAGCPCASSRVHIRVHVTRRKFTGARCGGEYSTVGQNGSAQRCGGRTSNV